MCLHPFKINNFTIYTIDIIPGDSVVVKSGIALLCNQSKAKIQSSFPPRQNQLIHVDGVNSQRLMVYQRASVI